MNKISVIMPAYNAEDYVALSLAPLLAMAKRGEVDEVIVVDDSSNDQTAILAEEMGATVIESGGRLGPAGARNKAVQHAKGEILWFVDADVVAHDNGATIISGAFTDQVVAVFGSYDDNPPAQNFLSQYKNLVHHYYHQQAKQEASTFWSGCGAVKKQWFTNLGGFDEQMFKHPSIEDIELGYRIIDAGGKMRLLPLLQCTHLKVWNIVNLLHTEIFRRAIPWSCLILKRNMLVDDLNVGVLERINAAMAGLLILSVAGMLFNSAFIFPMIVMFMLTMYLSKSLLGLFYRRRGWIFMVGGYLFHQLYYLYSSTAFVWSWVNIRLGLV